MCRATSAASTRPKDLQIRRLFAYPFPFFIVPIVALLAVFRPNENLFNFRDPIGWRLPISLLRDGPLMEGNALHRHEQERAPRHAELLHEYVLVDSCADITDLIPLTADEMEIHAPPDRIAGIGRFIGSDGEITFLSWRA